MIGVPFNPNNCVFISSMAVNADQFDNVVPDANNHVPCNLLWDFVANSLIWVNTKTNLILRELSTGVQNEMYSVVSAGPFNLNLIDTVYGNNWIVLPAGTYAIDAEYTYESDPLGPETAVFQIRSNINQASTTVNVTDVIEAERDSNPGVNTAVITQTAKCPVLTFLNPVIIKTSLSVLANTAQTQNVLLRAILIK